MKEAAFDWDIKAGNFSKTDLRFMYLNLTNNCNLRCLYCYDENSRKSDKVEIPLEVYRNLAEDSKKLGLKRVCLTGGEPFLHKHWFEIATYFRDAGVSISFSSNGTTITDKVVAKIKDLNADVQISLDGDEDLMTFVTGRHFAYKKVIEAIGKLKAAGIDVALAGVIGKHNFDAIDFLNDFSIKHDIVIKVGPYNKVFNDSTGKIQPLQIEDIHEMVYKVNEYHKTNKNLIVRMPPLLTPSEFNPKINPGCGWAYFVCGVLYSGDVTVCGLASGCPELVGGNILSDSFYKIWTESEVFKRLRSYSHKDITGICKECPVLDYCMGFCRLDPYLRYKDTLGPGYLCQQYYEAMVDGRIKTKVFPSGMLELVTEEKAEVAEA